MGHRANFVIIRNKKATAYYDQWAAMGCIYSFAAGPDKACEAISQFEQTTELMDWAFAEGGYLLDFDEKMAIGFGHPIDDDEFGDPDCNVDRQLSELNFAFEQGARAFLEYIGSAWVGWKLVWDDHGVDAFAAHLRARNIAEIAVQPDSHPPETAPPVEFQA